MNTVAREVLARSGLAGMRLFLCLSILASPAMANGAAGPVARCPPLAFRFEEDCSPLRASDLSGLQRLRYLPLDDEGRWWMQFGGQYRFRLEQLDHPNYGIGNIAGYTARGHRLLLDAALKSREGVSAFLELGAAAESGRQPAERSFDRGALDVQQAFIELPWSFKNATFRVRVGRQELDSAGNRLLAVRDVTNFRRTFNAGLLDATLLGQEFQLFTARPVVNAPGSFDDRENPTERLSGLTDTLRFPVASLHGRLDAFLFDRTVPKRSPAGPVAAERRRTLGVRSAVASASWEGAAQAAWQWGDRGGRPIRAYGVAAEIAHHFPGVWGSPRFGVSAGFASGDPAPARGATSTFDVLYPNLGYFTDAPLSYPGNTTDVRPTLAWLPLASLTLQVGGDWIFRNTSGDAVYSPAGTILVPGGRGVAGSMVALSDLRAVWKAHDSLELTASAVHASAGQVLSSVGGRDANYLLLQASVRL